MRPTRSNKGQMTGAPAGQAGFSPGSYSPGDLAARHRYAPAGTGIVPPRRKPRGLPEERMRNGKPVTSRSKVSSGWISRHRVTIFVTLIVLTLGALVSAGMVRAYRSFAGSHLFALRRVEILGTERMPREELTQALRQKIGKEGLWQADLAALRAEVMRYSWVRDAQVERVLPDTLRVTINEREPLALARRAGGAVVWVDRDGIVVGEQSAFKNRTIPPVISGLEEADGATVIEANRERLNVWQQLLSEFDRQEPRLSEKIDEINLADVHDVRLRLVEKKISVMLGETNFRARLEAALKVLDAVERKDVATLGLLNVGDAERIVSGGRVAYLKATRDDRVIVGLR
ncbi:MAG TPA: FtsQ-type POTRA domain-containing protein [Blastocatellia bacterium]|nr:FtsQ-type POTRA domain-containing protein [Blastocatellia bacterium]